MNLSKTVLCRAVAIGAVSSCTLFFAGITTAEAAHPVVRRETFTFEAQLPSADGFAIYLRASDRRKVWLQINSEPPIEPLTTMTYRTTGRVNRRGIEADFGEFGRIELHFSGVPDTQTFPYRNCRGAKRSVTRFGPMTGAIEFESVGGVVRLHANRVPEYGEWWYQPRRVCTPKAGRAGDRAENSLLRSQPPEENWLGHTFMTRARTVDRTIDLYALKTQGEVLDMAATSTRRLGAVLVETTVHAPFGEFRKPAVEFSVFGRDPLPRGAALSTLPPFSGSGTYRKPPGMAASWLGSLAVDMPGEGLLPLAGAEFHAILCGFASVKREQACERTVAPSHLVGWSSRSP